MDAGRKSIRSSANDCHITISGNSASQGDGGGLGNDGTARLIDCTISANSAEANGGGVFQIGSMTLTGCTIEKHKYWCVFLDGEMVARW